VASTKLEEHPLYSDESALGQVTDLILAQGHSVLQIFQMPADEREHSLWILNAADPQRKAREVLSLGCGVGGMEAHWKKYRSELNFELVNISQAQLNRCLCPGKKVRADAQTYRSSAAPFDLVVIAYCLGHVDAAATLESALENLAAGGKLVVYDVFSGSDHFDRAMHYDSPPLSQLERFGVEKFLTFRYVLSGGIPMAPFMRQFCPWAADEVMPALFVFQKRV
jgi:SAM-dependent methyltransferase